MYTRKSQFSHGTVHMDMDIHIHVHGAMDMDVGTVGPRVLGAICAKIRRFRNARLTQQVECPLPRLELKIFTSTSKLTHLEDSFCGIFI